MRRVVLDMPCNMFAEAISQALTRSDPDFAVCLADNFIYGSVSPDYLAAVMDALRPEKP